MPLQSYVNIAVSEQNSTNSKVPIFTTDIYFKEGVISNMKLKFLIPLLLALSLLGCTTVDLPTGVVNTTSNLSAELPTSETPTTSVATSAPSSKVETSVPASSKESSAPVTTSAPPSSKETPSSKSVTSAPPPASSKATPSSKPVTSSKPAPSSTPSSAPASSTVTSDYSNQMQPDMASIEDEILNLVNELRSSLGVHALTKNSQLKSSAFVRSQEMALNDYFTHTRPNGTKFYTAIDEVGYPYSYVAENLAKAEGLTREEYALSLFNGWKDSQSHYNAMISDKTFETGISLYEYNGKLYGTQHFGVKK